MRFLREPTVLLQALSAVLALVVSFKVDFLTSEQSGLVIAFIAAVIGGINAALVRPLAPAAFTAVVTTLAALVTSYGLHLAPETVGAVQLVVVSVLALATRVQVTPKADPRPEDHTV